MTQAPWQFWLAEKAQLAGFESFAALAAAHGLKPGIGRDLYRAVTTAQGTHDDVLAALAPTGVFPGALTPRVLQDARDTDTTKGLFTLRDGLEIESVLMRHHGRRNTVCVSSQAGCAYRCAFCATGQAGFNRHLKATEIVDQVLYFNRRLAEAGEQVTNVVFMGMGEPFHNYQAVRQAVRILCDESGLSLARRQVTISTVGLVPEIRAFADEEIAVSLAISLHAPTDEQRSRLMPVNDRYPLSELMAACADYASRTGRRIFFEYLMLAGLNDRDEDARALAALMRQGDYHANLIPYNATDAGFTGSAEERVRAFQAILKEAGVPTTVRQPMGRDIAAACGQLQAETQPRAGRAG
ncbi:MAG TPA: 23S rRNA (adenine(2503)-C(2))-methyltransferase RlmN [Stenomitos sp.]